MEKYSITVCSKSKASKINGKIDNLSPWDKEDNFDGCPLHVGINYTSEPLVYECAKSMEFHCGGIVTETMGKEFDLRKEFSKFRLCKSMDVYISDPIDTSSIYTLYLWNRELVSIGISDVWDDDRKYTVFVDTPYYENGLQGFEKRKVKSRNKYIFLKTRSAKIAFNMVNRIVANMRYPKAKNIW